ncbi:LPD29 domain-containing protein [Xylella fastidiosa]|uniref:LPD29 domain-containing protein n=1 Tax=Xylella fastidiosa TaxID=2371 RepID=UPI00373FE3E4
MKFSVRSNNYSGGASINVSLINGPNFKQVEDITRRFESSYFDGSIDYKGSIYHVMQGQIVRFGSDFVLHHRDYSDAAIPKAIDAVYLQFESGFKSIGADKPTLSDYNSGSLWRIRLDGMRDPIYFQVNRFLVSYSDRLNVNKSITAASVIVTHDDGYSRTNGSGMSVVPTDL